MRALARTQPTFLPGKVGKTIRSGTPPCGYPAFLEACGAKRTRDLRSLRHLFASPAVHSGTRWPSSRTLGGFSMVLVESSPRAIHEHCRHSRESGNPANEALFPGLRISFFATFRMTIFAGRPLGRHVGLKAELHWPGATAKRFAPLLDALRSANIPYEFVLKG